MSNEELMWHLQRQQDEDSVGFVADVFSLLLEANRIIADYKDYTTVGTPQANLRYAQWQKKVGLTG